MKIFYLLAHSLPKQGSFYFNQPCFEWNCVNLEISMVKSNLGFKSPRDAFTVVDQLNESCNLGLSFP